MYININRAIVHDNQAYTAIDGTYYPKTFPKNLISELSPVTLTERPEGKYILGYTVDETNTQVWNYRDKTAEELYQEQLNAVYSSRTAAYGEIGDQLDMMYKDMMYGTTTWIDHITNVKSIYTKP